MANFASIILMYALQSFTNFNKPIRTNLYVGIPLFHDEKLVLLTLFDDLINRISFQI